MSYTLPAANVSAVKALPATIVTLADADAVLRLQAGISARRVRANLRRVAERATVAQRLTGIVWYWDACKAGTALDVRYGLPKGTGACVIAALSPRTRWSDNLAYARAILATPHVRPAGCMPSNYDRALNVISACVTGVMEDEANGYVRGASVWSAMVSALGNGPKVYAFAHNVAGDESHVTLDVWAMRAAIIPNWKRNDDMSSVDALIGRKSVYAALSVVYAAEAKRVGMTPAQFQAVVWCSISGFESA